LSRSSSQVSDAALIPARALLVREHFGIIEAVNLGDQFNAGLIFAKVPRLTRHGGGESGAAFKPALVQRLPRSREIGGGDST
jgi:hypothetical protein